MFVGFLLVVMFFLIVLLIFMIVMIVIALLFEPLFCFPETMNAVKLLFCLYFKSGNFLLTWLGVNFNLILKLLNRLVDFAYVAWR
jgi:hypothetical protein